MRIEIDSSRLHKLNSSSGSLGHNVEHFNGTEIDVNDRITSPTVFKNDNPKGLRRCASNLVDTQKFAWSTTSPLDRESLLRDANSIPTGDVHTLVPPNQWIKGHQPSTNPTLVPYTESRKRNLPNWMVEDLSTRDPVQYVPRDSSNDICFRRLFPRIAHKNVTPQIKTDSFVNLASGVPPPTTMLQHTLYQEFLYHENKHVHTIPVPMPSRPRSQSIMIKGSPCQDDSFRSSSAEQMYDWATWRMYHRITSARNSKTTPVPVHSSTNSVPHTSTMISQSGDNFMMGHVVVGDVESESLSLDHTLEGEVFEIDDI